MRARSGLFRQTTEMEELPGEAFGIGWSSLMGIKFPQALPSGRETSRG